MLRLEVERGAERHDAGRIDVQHAHVIVPLDVVDVHRPGHARRLVELAQVVREVRIVGDAAQVALEEPNIDRIEAQQRGKQAPIGLGELRPQR